MTGLPGVFPRVGASLSPSLSSSRGLGRAGWKLPQLACLAKTGCAAAARPPAHVPPPPRGETVPAPAHRRPQPPSGAWRAAPPGLGRRPGGPRGTGSPRRVRPAQSARQVQRPLANPSIADISCPLAPVCLPPGRGTWAPRPPFGPPAEPELAGSCPAPPGRRPARTRVPLLFSRLASLFRGNGDETQQRPGAVCVTTDKHLKRHPLACGPYKGFRASFVQKSVLWRMEGKTLAPFIVAKGPRGKWRRRGGRQVISVLNTAHLPCRRLPGPSPERQVAARTPAPWARTGPLLKPLVFSRQN